MPKPVNSDPTNPIRHELMIQLEGAYEAYGRPGIQHALYKYAEERLVDILHPAKRFRDESERDNQIQSWNCLVEDEAAGTSHVAKLLQQLPDEIIKPLLRGELAHAINHDANVKSFCEGQMQLLATPCIYINLLHDNDGRWLSSKNMGRLLDKIQRYLQRDPEGLRPDQKLLNSRLSKWTGPRGELRWAITDQEREIVQEYINLARKVYCTSPTAPDVNFPMGPTEVGWASNGVASALALKNNTSSTCIFGLLNSICRAARPFGFSFPEPTQLALFYLWERNENLCRVGEVVGSLVSASYHHLGGVNHRLAGDFHWDQPGAPKARLKPPASNSIVWNENTRRVWRRISYKSVWPMHEDNDKINFMLDAVEESKKLPAINKRIEELKVLQSKAEEEHRNTQALIKAAEAENAELREKLDKARGPRSEEAKRFGSLASRLKAARRKHEEEQAKRRAFLDEEY